MARIELRHTTIRFKDGLSGTAAVNDVAGLAAGASTATIDTVVLNTTAANKVPIGARFKIGANSTIYTVTARTPASAGPTTDINFSPVVPETEAALDNAVITFLPQQIEITVGDGNLSYTEHNEYNYDLDRGQLDTVREGDQVPMDVSLEFVYEFITTGTSETITPMDAIKGKGGAAEWVSASADLCEPYCIDIEVEHNPPCGSAEKETTTFPEFRSEDREVSFADASISVSGRCNAVEPIVTRAS